MSSEIPPASEVEQIMDALNEDYTPLNGAELAETLGPLSKLARSEYELEKAKLKAELLKVQHWAQETRQEFAVLFEGRDASGKGGTIKPYMERLNPRSARLVALNKPSGQERGQWYFQR